MLASQDSLETASNKNIAQSHPTLASRLNVPPDLQVLAYRTPCTECHDRRHDGGWECFVPRVGRSVCIPCYMRKVTCSKASDEDLTKEHVGFKIPDGVIALPERSIKALRAILPPPAAGKPPAQLRESVPGCSPPGPSSKACNTGNVPGIIPGIGDNLVPADLGGMDPDQLARHITRLQAIHRSAADAAALYAQSLAASDALQAARDQETRASQERCRGLKAEQAFLQASVTRYRVALKVAKKKAKEMKQSSDLQAKDDLHMHIDVQSRV